jgi:hypothetical protein
MRLQFAVHVDAVEARQGQIENNGVRNETSVDPIKRIDAIGDGGDEKTIIDEILAIKFSECVVILHDEQCLSRRRSTFRSTQTMRRDVTPSALGLRELRT